MGDQYLIYEAVSICRYNPSDRTVAVLGKEGQVSIINGDSISQIYEVPDSLSLGPFRTVKTIGNQLFVLGGARDVLQYETSGWKSLSKGLPAMDFSLNEEDLVSAIIGDTEIWFDFDGNSPEYLYAVGSGGEVWNWNYQQWWKKDCPTNLTLNSIHFDGKNRYIFCGQNGLLIQLESDLWNLIDIGDIETDFVSLTTLNDHIYLSDGNNAYHIIQEEELKKLDFNTGEDIPAHYVTSSNNEVLFLAAKEVFLGNSQGDWISLLA